MFFYNFIGIMEKYFWCFYVYFFMVVIMCIYVYIVISDYLCVYVLMGDYLCLFVNKCVKL